MLLLDLPGQRLVLLRCCRHLPFFQTAVEAVDLRDRLEDRVSVLRRHGIEFPDAALAVHFFGRTQIGVQLVQNGVELLVREGGIHLVGGVHPERKGDRRAAVQLRGPLLYIRGIAELPILREGGIRENVNVSGRGRLGPFVRVERLCYFAVLLSSCTNVVLSKCQNMVFMMSVNNHSNCAKCIGVRAFTDKSDQWARLFRILYPIFVCGVFIKKKDRFFMCSNPKMFTISSLFSLNNCPKVALLLGIYSRSFVR